jgi:hypothetical protein
MDLVHSAYVSKLSEERKVAKAAPHPVKKAAAKPTLLPAKKKIGKPVPKKKSSSKKKNSKR